MSHKYPCVYYDNGKCQKFSDDHYTAWCDFYQCEHITPSNGDRIRCMSDEELAEFLTSDICGTVSPKDFDCYGACVDCATIWLKQPYKEDI
jgi:hypothetical protein